MSNPRSASRMGAAAVTLMALSNRELKDIGISRSEIFSLAYGSQDSRTVQRHAHD